MLSKIRKSEQGFTLIELLIVVAIIGILAAIAIPQFGAYRQRAFNGAAGADVKNARTAQEALFADFQTYGKTQGSSAAMVTLLQATDTAELGSLANGPLPAATATIGGVALSGPRNSDGAAVGVGSGISNGVILQAENFAPAGDPAFGSASFTMTAKHTQGTRVFATETEGSAIWYVEDSSWGGTAMGAGGLPANAPGCTLDADMATTVDGGGSPLANWTAL